MIKQDYEYYVSLEVAKLLREAGFDWNCYKVYKTDVTENLTLFTYTKEEGYRNTSEFICSAPTLDVAQRWLREVKGIHICVQPVNSEVNKKTHKCDIEYLVIIFVNNNSIGGVDFVEMTEPFKTHEDAQETGIKKALEIILKKGK